ncbi:MBL fold metallo-hydrolase [Bacteriovoracaceae bacterium]|nr:MBL fold metallo-hydrolase [Bacteriovoracaceae bacterium]
MKVTFFGGASGVTGSKALLEVSQEKYLVDYGMFQGSSEEREKNWLDFPMASEVSAVFLTHAHIDHSGLLPRLWADGFRGSIYCSEDTYKLCQILLADSAKIHEEDAEYANKKKYSRHSPASPLYRAKEVKEVLKLFKVIDFGTEFEISQNLKIQLFWAGHILGASSIKVFYKDYSGESKSILFSGDLGHDRNTLLKSPAKLEETDFLVLESTYGDKLHPRIPAKEVLALYVNTILKRGGVAVIPSFSVGRTQDILFLIKQLIDEKKITAVPVILDSPLSKKANKIFNECLRKEFVREDIMEKSDYFPETLLEIDSTEDSINISAADGPMIIISASGMIEGGRVVHHVKSRISNKKNGIILVGFQPYGTKGRLLLDGIKVLRLHKEEFPVLASIFSINSLSAHADYLDTIDWLKTATVKPRFIILNHGEESGSLHLKSLIESELEINTTIATYGESYELDSIPLND